MSSSRELRERGFRVVWPGLFALISMGYSATMLFHPEADMAGKVVEMRLEHGNRAFGSTEDRPRTMMAGPRSRSRPDLRLTTLLTAFLLAFLLSPVSCRGVEGPADDREELRGSSIPAVVEQEELGVSSLLLDDVVDEGESSVVAGSTNPAALEPASHEGEEAPEERAGPEVARFQGQSSPLSEAVREHMTGRSWRAGCPVGLDDLVLLSLTHWDMNGSVALGELVVLAKVEGEVIRAFERLFELGFPIEKMRRIAYYDGDDDQSMADNNTSAFNCRRVAGSPRWSEHSYGTAVDINPMQNPYVRGDLVTPPAGRAYLDRSNVRPGMLVPGPAVRAFKDMGWGWGGDWRRAKDYQHLSKSGR